MTSKLLLGAVLTAAAVGSATVVVLAPGHPASAPAAPPPRPALPPGAPELRPAVAVPTIAPGLAATVRRPGTYSPPPALPVGVRDVVDR